MFCADHRMGTPGTPGAGAPLPAAGLELHWFNQHREGPICISSDYISSSRLRFFSDLKSVFERHFYITSCRRRCDNSNLWTQLSFHLCLSLYMSFSKHIMFGMLFYFSMKFNPKYFTLCHIILMCVYFCVTETRRGRSEREKGTENPKQALHNHCRPCLRIKLRNHEIMTWAKINSRHLTDWATQVLHFVPFSIVWFCYFFSYTMFLVYGNTTNFCMLVCTLNFSWVY